MLKILVPIYYLCALALAVTLLMNASAVAERERAISQLQTPEEKTDTLLKNLLENMSMGYYEGASEKALIQTRLTEAAKYHRDNATASSWALAGGSMLFLGALLLSWFRGRAGGMQRLSLHLFGVSAICLLVGLFAPMLTIIAQREVMVLGKVVLQFESKSIFGTVFSLYTKGNGFTALLLFLFSVVVPISKLAISLTALLARSDRTREACRGLVRAIGKWSMTDVFVVAVLLAFLATGHEQLTDARLGPGLYFFAAYGLLSMISGLTLGQARVVAAAPRIDNHSD